MMKFSVPFIKLICPEPCLCLAAAVSCDGVEIYSFTFQSALHFDAVLLKQTEFNLSTTAILSPVSVKIFAITQTNLTSICELLTGISAALSFDLKSNMLLQISTGCFSDQIYLRIILLNNNNIFTMKQASFSNLWSLKKLRICLAILCIVFVSPHFRILQHLQLFHCKMWTHYIKQLICFTTYKSKY